MESEGSLDHLITVASEKLIAFDHRLNQLNLIRFPSDNPKLLIALLRRLGEAFQRKITNYRTEFVEATKEETRRLIKKEIIFSVIFIKTLGARLRYIEGASVERTPWSMVHAMEQLAQGLLQEVSLIIRPQWHYNYGGVDVIKELRAEIRAAFKESFDEILSVEEWKGIYNKLPDRFYALSFPGLERDNALLHVNLGHEIGHLIVEEFLAQEEPKWSERIRKSIDESVEDANTDQTARRLMIEDRVQRVQLIRKRALEEIISDYFSIYLFGPAALFALHEVAIFAESLDNVSDDPQYYPPWRLRLRLGLEELDWKRWRTWLKQVSGDFHWRGDRIKGGKQVAQALNKKVRLLEQTAKETADQAYIESRPLIKLAYNTLKDTLPAAKDFLRSKLQSQMFVGDATACRTILQLVERLNYGIPPNEVGGGVTTSPSPNIADIRAIFNAGWFYRIAYLPSMFHNFESTKDYFERLQILNRLILKGIEMGDLQRNYEEHKSSRMTRT